MQISYAGHIYDFEYSQRVKLVIRRWLRIPDVKEMTSQVSAKRGQNKVMALSCSNGLLWLLSSPFLFSSYFLLRPLRGQEEYYCFFKYLLTFAVRERSIIVSFVLHGLPRGSRPRTRDVLSFFAIENVVGSVSQHTLLGLIPLLIGLFFLSIFL